jgi:hypothetical protein
VNDPYLHLPAADIVIKAGRQVEPVIVITGTRWQVVCLARYIVPVGRIVVIYPELDIMCRVTVIVPIHIDVVSIRGYVLEYEVVTECRPRPGNFTQYEIIAIIAIDIRESTSGNRPCIDSQVDGIPPGYRTRGATARYRDRQ